MPKGDGSGPAGYGPRTGRGAGFCNGFERPGFFRGGAGGGFSRGNFGRGAGGAGFGRMGGMGRVSSGYNNANFPPMGIQRVSDTEYKNILAEEAGYLEKRLADIKDQLSSENGDKE